MTHTASMPVLLTLALLALAVRLSAALFLPNSPELQQLLSRYQQEADWNSTANADTDAQPHVRQRRAIPWSDREEILKLHNKLRGGVYPTASNMEYMVWDDQLERSATHWAEQCIWDHGPHDLLMSIGQNLAVHWGRYRSPAYHVQAWYDEVKDYTYPYPHECNPWCPDRCSGPMCTHYTQVTSIWKPFPDSWITFLFDLDSFEAGLGNYKSRGVCRARVSPDECVGEMWENAVYLVCNYSPKGNWIGEAPYQHGRPCSQCPPSYGGGCRDNLCYKGDNQRHETEDMNEVERQQVPMQPRVTTTRPKPKPRPTTPKRPAAKPSSPRPSTQFLAQNVKCETKMRDKCRGATCNRYKCPANCLNKKGKVWGTLYYDVQSSICRAAMHYGVIDNSGGLVDITRKDQLPFFVKSTKNGIESFSKYKPSNAFVVAKVERQSLDCYATVAEICPYKKPYTNCPRVYCPARCRNQPSYWAPVVGNSIYADSSSICRAAIHAGVLNDDGGYVDILALERKKSYVGTLKNSIQSDSKSSHDGGSFRVFAVRE